MTRCNNARHPNGVWHVSSPMAIGLVARARQWVNRRRWGCSCGRSTPLAEYVDSVIEEAKRRFP